MKNLKKFLFTFYTCLWIIMGAYACQMNNGPKPIKYGTDQCSYCKMTISDQRFATQLQTKKGKTYNFDDVQCMIAFVKEQTVKKEDIAIYYLADYNNNTLLPAGKLFYLKSEDLKSPMRGDIAAFHKKEDLEKIKASVGGEILTWDDLWR